MSGNARAETDGGLVSMINDIYFCWNYTKIQMDILLKYTEIFKVVAKV